MRTRRTSGLRVPSIVIALALGAVAAEEGAPEPPLPAPSRPAFTHGVASGDIRSGSAVLWTRADRQSLLFVEVSTDPSFPPSVTLRRIVAARARDDFAAKALVAPLQPGQSYFYRFMDVLRRSASPTGTFTTAPAPDEEAPVRFTYAGDSDGTRVGGVPAFNEFEVLARAREEEGDFFVYLGDTIYADSSFAPAPAVTLDEYRARYKENRTYDALRDLLASTSTYAIWDDHEVLNDFDGQSVDPLLFANGREAFREYMPVEGPAADLGFFRAFQWGRDVLIVILDERSFRSGDVTAACSGDLGPALPPSVRVLLGLLPAPPPGCLEALRDPSRTMLGAPQKALLKSLLAHSRARFKFIVNEVPISEIFINPYDRWEGYRAERDEILSFIGERSIPGVVFLTTDLHANLVSAVRVSALARTPPLAKEIITGPIARFTLQRSLALIFGPENVERVLALIASLNPPEFVELDAFAYGLVEADPATGTGTVTIKDDAGAILHRSSIP